LFPGRGAARSGAPLIRDLRRLGGFDDPVTALDCCARLPEDFWTPGLDGAPAGNKAEIAAELRRIAAAAQRKGG